MALAFGIEADSPVGSHKWRSAPRPKPTSLLNHTVALGAQSETDFPIGTKHGSAALLRCSPKPQPTSRLGESAAVADGTDTDFPDGTLQPISQPEHRNRFPHWGGIYGACRPCRNLFPNLSARNVESREACVCFCRMHSEFGIEASRSQLPGFRVGALSHSCSRIRKG